MVLELTADIAGAEEHYRKAIALRTDFLDAYLRLAALLQRSGRGPEALAAAERAAAIAPGNAGVRNNLGNILRAMERDAGRSLTVLKVDGGASANDLLMQFQSDVLGVEISRPEMVETTALGAAFLAGLGTGVWKDQDQVRQTWREQKRFQPTADRARVTEHFNVRRTIPTLASLVKAS